MTYKVELAVNGVDLLGEKFHELLERFPDAGWRDRAGTVIATLYSDADIAFEACTFSRQLEHSGLGKVTGVVDDFVNVSEIAARLDVNRETVRSWVAGTRGPGDFPSPCHMHGGSGEKGPMKVWRWSDVDSWLSGLGLADGFSYPTRAQIVTIESHLHRLEEPAGREWQEMHPARQSAGDSVGWVQEASTPSKNSRYAAVKPTRSTPYDD